MTTDITIPAAALEAGVKAMIAKDSGPEGSALFNIHWNEFSETYRGSLRAACLAMIEAWPGMQERKTAVYEERLIILPLPPQENPDDKA